MKKALQFSGLIAAVIAIVGFILLMTTPALAYANGNWKANIDGIDVLFGTKKTYDLGFLGNATATTNAAPVALIGWILVVVALLCLICGFVLPMAKKDLGKAAGMLNLVAAVALIVAGILLFFTLPNYAAANSWNGTDYWGLGGGWVVAAILAIVAGACALAPTIANFVSKK